MILTFGTYNHLTQRSHIPFNYDSCKDSESVTLHFAEIQSLTEEVKQIPGIRRSDNRKKSPGSFWRNFMKAIEIKTTTGEQICKHLFYIIQKNYTYPLISDIYISKPNTYK